MKPSPTQFLQAFVRYLELHQTFKAERPCEGMNSAGIKGLGKEAIATLIRLGAKSGDR
jgi:hypothetical protein